MQNERFALSMETGFQSNLLSSGRGDSWSFTGDNSSLGPPLMEALRKVCYKGSNRCYWNWLLGFKSTHSSRKFCHFSGSHGKGRLFTIEV